MIVSEIWDQDSKLTSVQFALDQNTMEPDEERYFDNPFNLDEYTKEKTLNEEQKHRIQKIIDKFIAVINKNVPKDGASTYQLICYQSLFIH